MVLTHLTERPDMKARDILLEGCKMLMDIASDWDAREIVRHTGCSENEAEKLYQTKLAVAEFLKET